MRNFDGNSVRLARLLSRVAGVVLMAAFCEPELCPAQGALTNAAADTSDRWPAVTLPAPRDVELGGPVGERACDDGSFRHGRRLARIRRPWRERRRR